MSQGEITRLSLRIIPHWKEIAGLANLDKGEVANVKQVDNIQFAQPKDKAGQILTMINEKADFSRKELGGHLEEVGLRDLVDKVLKGTLRQSPDQAVSPIPSPNQTTES